MSWRSKLIKNVSTSKSNSTLNKQHRLVKLASHEILSVREAARTMFLQILDRIRSNDRISRSLLRLLEAKWDDSREFAQQVFNTQFTIEDWTPDVMVSICDSIRDDVRQFGRD
ncbi:MAG TPA: hypothetical protein V6D50_13025 [Chroococcales cyanobacterium]